MSRLLLLLFVILAWAGPGKKDKAAPETPSIVAQARAVGSTDRMEAVAILEDYLATGEGDPELVGWVALEAGEQRRLTGDTVAARAHFAAVDEEHPAHDPATLGLALVAVEGGKASGNTWATLEMIGETGVPPTMDADRYRVLALHKAAEGAPEEEVRRLAELAVQKAAADPQVKARVSGSVAHLLAPDAAALPQDAADQITLERARSALAAKDYARAQQLADEFTASYPDSEHLLEATWIGKRAAAKDPFNARKVGLLLPLSGTYAQPGKQLRDSITMGLESSGAQVVVRDTQGKTDVALKMFEELVLQEGCAIVVGPMLQDEAALLAPHAQAAGVPLVLLSSAPHLTDAGPYVFRTFLTVEQQVDALLDHVMGVQGLTAFAILAPDNEYGRQARDEFTRQVLERGGSITDTVMYDPTKTDFRADAYKLGEKAGRGGELARAKKEMEAAGMDPSKAVIPPKVDMQAIFVPDSAARVALVAAALAYEEFPVGDFRAKKGMASIPMLGLNGWNNADLPAKGGLYVVDAIFVDAWWPENEGAADFTSTYKSVNGHAPATIEAIGYDTGRLVGVAVKTAPVSRDAARTALAGAALGSPMAGTTRFDADRDAERSLTVLTIVRDVGIRPALGAPPAEAPAPPQ